MSPECPVLYHGGFTGAKAFRAAGRVGCELGRQDREKEGAVLTLREMAGVAGLEPVTSAVTGQRSNQLSYTPARGPENLGKRSGRVKPKSEKIFGQQTPRRWGWGTPLKKRTATRTLQLYEGSKLCQPLGLNSFFLKLFLPRPLLQGFVFVFCHCQPISTGLGFDCPALIASLVYVRIQSQIRGL
jgi:hypothetical protein